MITMMMMRMIGWHHWSANLEVWRFCAAVMMMTVGWVSFRRCSLVGATMPPVSASMRSICSLSRIGRKTPTRTRDKGSSGGDAEIFLLPWCLVGGEEGKEGGAVTVPAIICVPAKLIVGVEKRPPATTPQHHPTTDWSQTNMDR